MKMIDVAGYALQEKMRHNHNIDTYYALRLKDQCRVLLKTPVKPHSNSENIALLQHEYHLLNMIESSTIIKAYTFLQDEYAPVLILEDVKGQLLTTYLLTHELSMDTFFNFSFQLVDIIGELHRHNIIHKEIKPSNIVIDPDNMILKLVDLSASIKLNNESIDYLKFELFEEDLAYISPEQTGRINRPVDYRTDFYSLGVTFYEMLTNQLPFTTLDALELVHCHIAQKPPSVLKTKPEVPKMLAKLIDKLLKKMPEERYASIVGLKSDLQQCFTQWQNKDENEFLLGANDIHDHLSISHTLYGREQEVQQLLKGFERISQGSKEMLFISGYSGIGKTSLVNEVHKPIVQHQGYYIQGKFDQLQQSTPYSAIVDAFRSLLKQVLSQGEEQLKNLRQQLIHALENMGQVIIDVIPEVELIIGKQPQVHELLPTEAQVRFNIAFQNFVRVFAQADHPLVLFMDDLQWADNSSLNLIENLLLDEETRHLLIIGAYRDNEVDAHHPLQLWINRLNRINVNINALMLAPLQLDNVQELLYDTLPRSQKIPELAQCIFTKTHGNPFFTNQFLQMIHQQNILKFSYKKGVWIWNLRKVQQQSPTDNVIDLLSVKIHLLPESSQNILKLASCFGHQFDLRTLHIISGQTISQIAEQLGKAIEANLIYPQEASYKTLGLVGVEDKNLTILKLASLHYHFAHDRIQQATYALIQETDKPKIHLQIGRLLLQNNPLTQHNERLFEVLKHFNHSIALIHSPQERLQLAQYNLWAGQKAKAASAYDIANKYLAAGIKFLKPVDWGKNYDVAFQLYKEIATCKYLMGNTKAGNKCFSVLLGHTKDKLDEIEVYRIKMEMLTALGKNVESVEIGVKTLRALGIKIPKKNFAAHVLLAVLKIKWQLRGKQIESLDLPLMTDPKQIAIANMFSQLLESTRFIDGRLVMLLACINLSLSLRYGYTEDAAMYFIGYASFYMHQLNRYDEALAFVKLCNHLQQKYGNHGKAQLLLGCSIEPYQKPIQQCNNTLIHAFELCYETGRITYASYCSLVLIYQSLLFGKSLAEVKKNTHAALSFMARAKVTDFIHLANFYDYMTQCLEVPELIKTMPQQLTVFEKKIIKEKNTSELAVFYNNLTIVHFLFGNIKEAVNAGNNHEPLYIYDTYLVLNGKFFYALALAQYFPEMPPSERRSCLKKLKVLHQYIKKCATWCPANFKAHDLLVTAELLRIEQSHNDPSVLYEQARAVAHSSGFVLLEAIASERAGSYCLEAKTDEIAKIYLQHAHQLFTDWGAHTKVKLLESTYPKELWEQTFFHQASNISPLKKEPRNLDMLAILKSTQLISSEIHLDKLLQKLLVIVLENAGAQKSIILTKVKNKWLVEAEGTIEQQVMHLNNNIIEDETKAKYPISLLNYVQRTQEPIILNDAVQSDLTFQDAYVQQENPRSLLMMPLFYKGKLARILYLENNSSSHAFTLSHLDSLQLLASQAMISLDNARHYYQATHDPLTGLANRNLLYERFQQTTNQQSHSQGKVALLFLDLDYFKAINDTLGHDVGDKLLIHIANTLTANLSSGDVVARLGGDEFAVMIANMETMEQLAVTIERLFKEITRPVHIKEHLVQVSSSMGISIFPKDGRKIQKLLKLADTALYHAKENGRNQFHYYSLELRDEYNRLHDLSKELQQAFEQEEFFLMYQPIYDMNAKIIGLEALIRWNHPHKGILETKNFIHILEKHPLIIPVSEWIIKKVCQQAKAWQDKGILAGPIAINVSPTQFSRSSIAKTIAEAIAEAKISPSSIELEITESLLLEFNDKLYEEMDLLRKLQVNLVIDDFGVGYSSLSYLKLLPVNKIKIDKIFISKGRNEYFDQVIIRGITTMAHQLNIQVIVEGVETEAQLKLLKQHLIDGIQGYYYSYPLTAEGCEQLLKTNIDS